MALKVVKYDCGHEEQISCDLRTIKGRDRYHDSEYGKGRFCWGCSVIRRRWRVARARTHLQSMDLATAISILSKAVGNSPKFARFVIKEVEGDEAEPERPEALMVEKLDEG